MRTAKDALRDRIQKMPDKSIKAILDHPAIADWRNWGDNIERLMAEEAHRRGMLT